MTNEEALSHAKMLFDAVFFCSAHSVLVHFDNGVAEMHKKFGMRSKAKTKSGVTDLFLSTLHKRDSHQ